MPPKKASAPAPASDESDSDLDDRPARKPSRKPARVIKSERRDTSRNPDEQLEAAVEAMYDGKNNESDAEDDHSDLFSLELPPRPKFLTKPDRSNRLMILNVEVENFKSYYGKASIGPFHKSFTSIIGPNGSGKSNLIDSLLFVFGFRASKIRSAKVGNLVHKSRGKEPKSCTVTIYFQRIIDQPNQTYTVVDNSKFTISRTAFTNNSSSYAIDGRPASKTEVEARLRKVDIDIEHNRFLILQGEVEQIAMMKPVKVTKTETGMVEYLEDIIGSNRLEPYVKRFQRRVNRLLCEQSQQRIAREHARTSKTAMEGNVRTAIEFLMKENEKTTMEMKVEQRKRLKYLDKAAPLQEALEARTAEMKEVAGKLDANKEQYKETDELDKKLTKEKSKLEKEIDKITKELTDLATEETRRKETLKRYETDIQKTEAEKEKEVKKKATLEAAPEKAAKKIDKLKEEIETLKEIEKTANEEATKNLPEFEKEAEKPKEDQKKLQEDWAKANSEFNKIRTEATIASDQLEDMKKLANSGTKKLDDLKTRYGNYQEKNEKEVAELETIKPEFERTQEKLKRLQGELPPLQTECRNKQYEFARAQGALEEKKRRNESQNSSQLIKILTQYRDQGVIPSFKGRIGELACVDKKYDGAFSTNYPRLQWLLVGKEADSPKLIDLLIKHNLGRHTILPMDKMNKVDKRNMLPAPDGKYPRPRMFDLVECDDEEVREVYYNMLGETIVTDTVKSAQELNKHPQCRKINVATMCGSLIHHNGQVTGGGGTKYGFILTDKSKKPKTVSAEDKQELIDLTKKVEELQKEAQEIKEKERKMEYDNMETRRIVAELTAKVQTLENSIQADTSVMATLRKTIDAQEKEAAKVKVDKKEIEAKQELVTELFKKRDELGEQASKAKERQEKVQEKLDELFRNLVQCHRDEAHSSQQKRQKMEKDMAKEEASIANSSRNIAKCDDNINRLQRDVDKKRKMIEELEERAPDQEAEEAKKTAVEELEKKRKQSETEYAEMSKKRSGLTNEEIELEEKLKKKSEEVQEVKLQIGAHQIKIKDIENKLSALKINRIPTFQFLDHTNRPEDLEMQFEEELPVVDENQSPEEVEKQKKHMACVMSDAAYALEFEMRRKVLENTESYDNVEGDKLMPVVLLPEEEIRAITKRDEEELAFKVKASETALDALKGKVDLSCIDTYVEKVKHYNKETLKLLQVTEDYRKHNIELHRIKKMRLEEFHSAFEFIGKHLVAVYKMLTDGGDAKLEYIDKDDPFTQGISFMVRPAKKAWKQIQFLSGGEKTLSSLALIFALHMFRPTPFYVMDEIDAALDYRNVSIIAQYVRQKTENAQFIIISLRNNMFELANRLVGIYKVDGCTQNVAIDPLAVCEAAKVLALNLEEVYKLTRRFQGIHVDPKVAYNNMPTTPAEVTRAFQETRNRQNQEMTAREKQYPNFPSSSEINKAEKIVSVEGRVRKEIDTTMATTSNSRPNTRATNSTERPASTRPESRLHQMRIPAPRLVARSSSSAAPPTSRTPRKERNNESDETTPPAKRANSVQSPRKGKKSPEKSKKRNRLPSPASDEDSF